jgi:phosphohistidine phosphatase
MSDVLTLMRHCDAVEGGAWPGTPEESAYDLTALGRVQAHAAGTALRRLGTPVEKAICSPKARAVQSAELACAALGVPWAVEPSLSGEGFDATSLAQSEGVENLLIIGHSPSLQDAVQAITGGRERIRKGGVLSLFASEVIQNLPPLVLATIAGVALNAGPEELHSASLGPGQLPARLSLRQQYLAAERREDDQVIALATAAGLL